MISQSVKGNRPHELRSVFHDNSSKDGGANHGIRKTSSNVIRSSLRSRH